MESNTLEIYHRESRTLRNKRTASWHKRNREKSYLLAARKRAKKEGIPFDLTPEDIVFPNECPVLGIPLYFSDRRGDNTPSLDKVVPSLGYVKGNISIISWKANRLKNNATLDELRKLVKYMETH